MESLACLQGRLSNVELLPLACYKIPSLPLHTAMVRLSETTLTLGEKRMSELSIASRIIPAGWKPLPQGYILSPTSQWSQKDCSWESKTYDLSVHWAFLVARVTSHLFHIASPSLGCEGFFFLSGKRSAIHYLSRTKEEEVQQILLLKVGPDLCKWVEMKSRNR